MNLFVGRPFQAVVTAKNGQFDALKRASYIFHSLVGLGVELACSEISFEFLRGLNSGRFYNFRYEDRMPETSVGRTVKKVAIPTQLVNWEKFSK